MADTRRPPPDALPHTSYLHEGQFSMRGGRIPLLQDTQTILQLTAFVLATVAFIVADQVSIAREAHNTRETQKELIQELIVALKVIETGTEGDTCPPECQLECLTEGSFIVNSDDTAIVVNRDGVGADVPLTVNKFDLDGLNLITGEAVFANEFRRTSDNQDCCVPPGTCPCIFDVLDDNPTVATMDDLYKQLNINPHQRLAVDRIAPALYPNGTVSDSGELFIQHPVVNVENDFVWNRRQLWNSFSDYLVGANRSFSLTFDQITRCGQLSYSPFAYASFLDPQSPNFLDLTTYDDEENPINHLSTENRVFGLPTSYMPNDFDSNPVFLEDCADNGQPFNSAARSRRSNTQAEAIAFYTPMQSTIDSEDIRQIQSAYDNTTSVGKPCADFIINPNPYVDADDHTKLSDITEAILSCGIRSGTNPVAPQIPPSLIFSSDSALQVSPPFAVKRGALYTATYGATFLNFNPVTELTGAPASVDGESVLSYSIKAPNSGCTSFYTDTLDDDANCNGAQQCDFSTTLSTSSHDVALQLYLFCTAWNGAGNLVSQRYDGVFQTLHRVNPIVMNFSPSVNSQKVNGQMTFVVNDDAFDATDGDLVGQCAVFPAATPFMLNLHAQRPLVIDGNVLINRNNTVQIPGVTGFENLPTIPITDQLPNVVSESGGSLVDDGHEFSLETVNGALIYLPPSNTVPLFYSLNHYCEADGIMPLNTHLEITADLPGEPKGGVNFHAMSNAFDFSILDRRDVSNRVMTGKRGQVEEARAFVKKRPKPPAPKEDPLKKFAAHMEGKDKANKPDEAAFHATQRQNMDKKATRRTKRVTVEDVEDD